MLVNGFSRLFEDAPARVRRCSSNGYRSDAIRATSSGDRFRCLRVVDESGRERSGRRLEWPRGRASCSRNGTTTACVSVSPVRAATFPGKAVGLRMFHA